MSPTRALEKQRSLGELLYADGAPSVPELEWVRLVQAIATGDQAALRELYQRTHRLVFTLAMRICGHRDIAEELTVDVFHDVWRRSAQFDPASGSVIGWIMMLARSRAIDRLRFEQRKKRVPPHAHADVHHAGIEPGEAVDAQQRRSTLEDALAGLTPDEREAIETAFFSELSYAETAERLHAPVGTVKTRLRTALAKLRKTLGKGGPR